MQKLIKHSLLALMTFAAAGLHAETTLLPLGAVWKYLDTGANLGTTWTPLGFNDTAWASGAAELGYGDGDEATVVSFGPNSAQKFTTTYFRRTMLVTNVSSFGALTLTLTYDDGAVVYINGSEVWRVNMPGGTITSSTFASTAADYTPASTSIPASILVEGTNIVAVEVHQSDLASTDVSFNLSITANLAPTIAITAPANGATIFGPTNVALTANAVDPDGTITRVDYFLGQAAIGSATAAPYTVVATNLLEGSYIFTAVATDNSGGTSTSAPVNITVTDPNPPALLSAYGTTNTVNVTFTKRVHGAAALNPASYSVDNSVTVNGVAYGASSNIIVLQTSPIAEGVTYTLTVNNVQDTQGNPIAPNSQIQFTLATLLPANIGFPAIGGSLTVVPGGYVLTGSGTNIAGGSDQFTFGYQPIAGNFDLRIRVASLSAGEAWAKSGLMARQSLNADSVFAAALAGPNVFAASFHARSVTAGAATVAGSFPVNYPHTWLRLQRVGNVFNGYASFDGQNWTLLGTVTLAVPSTMFVGVAAVSANPGQLATAEVRDYSSAAGGNVVPFVPTREPLGPSTRRTGLIISEIMYHPKDQPDGKDLEFIELYNSMSIFEDISGYRITGDINYTFPPGTVMQPGTFLVLARTAADLQAHYGISGTHHYGVPTFVTNVVNGVTNVVTEIANSLNNITGQIRLLNRAGAILLDVIYDSVAPWPIQADGAGHSLILARPSYGEGDWQAWGPSDSIGGSPGTFDAISPEPARNVVINEFLAHTDLPAQDMIELYNHGNTAVDISGFYLTDSLNTNKFRIANGTVLPPRGFVSFSDAQLGFALSSDGEQILLVNSNQTRVIDALGFEPQENGVSMGRFPDGAPTFRRLSAVTAGSSNAAPLLSPVVINEIMYNPISGNADDEFIELYNRSASPVNLGDWEFTSGISYRFPKNTILPAGGYIVVARDRNHLRNNYTHLGPTNLVGNFDGSLANSGERIALSAPDYNVTTNGSGQVITNVDLTFVVCEVTYGDGGKWGHWSDGDGSSLELIDPDSDITLPSNWADSDETQKSTWTSFENTGPVDHIVTGQGQNDAVHVFMLGVGECIVDELEVRNAQNQNLLANGSFENGLTGWNPRGSHDQSFSDSAGFVGQGMHILAMSRGDNGINRIRAFLNPQLTTPTATLRGKARWLRGFPEVLMRVHGGGIEAFGRLPVPSNLGSPGQVNSRAVPNAGPAIHDVTHNPPLPQAGEPARVTARVHDPDGVSQFIVRYRLDPSTTFSSAALVDNGTGGDAVANDGLFTATIPAQSVGTMVAFHIVAVDTAGQTNLFPANALTRAFPNDAPSHEALIRWGEVQMPGSFATYHTWITDSINQRWVSRDRLNNAPLDATFVYNNYRVIYNLKPQYGGSPWHRGAMQGPLNPNVRVDYVLNFPEDNLLLGATDFVLNNVGNPGGGNTVSDRSGMVEQLSYEIFKGINVHYNYRRYIHVFFNGNQRSITGNLPGNYIMEDSQQPNGQVVEQWYPDDTEGQLYKIEDWFEFSDDAGAHSIDDGDLTRRMTTYNGVPTIDIAPYRFMWRKRSLGAGDSANNYSNLFTLIDIVSPVSNPGISPLPDPIMKQFGDIADFEQWMRIFAVQRTVGNWDAYGWERGKNGYTYRPERGKFTMMTWDIDFTMGVEGRAANADLFAGTSDPRIVAMHNTPEIARAYWRAFQDIINGPLNLSYLDPLIDGRTAAFRANNVSYDPSVIIGQIRPYIQQRRDYIAGRLATVAANFNVPSTSFTSSSNIVTITGTAPIDVVYIEIDGVRYPITWTGTTAWSLRLPMNVSGNNSFSLQALDRHGNALPGMNRTLNINFTGTVESPVGNVIFNEVMYNALVPGAEYVEIFNRATNFTFDLSGWQVNALGYTFPEGSVIGPRSFLVLAKDRVAFGNAYGGGVPVFDQFTGDLQPNGTTISLIRPATSTNGAPLIVDRVRYDSTLPWPLGANGTGSSFQLIDVDQDNARVGNWFADYVPAVFSDPVSTPATTNDGWRFVSATGSAGPGIGSRQMRIIIYLDNANGASALIDDLSIVEGTEPAVGFNHVRNGDFESPVLLEDPQLTNSWYIGTNYTNTVITSDLTHSGNGALRIEASTFGNSFPRLISQNLTPAPTTNAIYTLSYWFWATNSATNLNVRLFNSAALNTKTNINISVTPSNYIPPQLISPATNTLSPSVVNQPTAVLPAFPTLWINELQADNLNGLADNLGEREPWIEIYNVGSSTVSLDGLYLASTYTNLTEWAFPAGRTIAPGQFLIVFVDGEPGETSPSALHTSFRLPSGAGSIALSRLHNGQPQVIDYMNYVAIHEDRSFGSFPDGQPFDRTEMFYVTPGAPNDGRSAPLNVFINEWMVSNTNFLADPADDDYDDWFELYNPGPNAVSIAGYYLTDTLSNKTKYLITTNGPHIIPPQGYLLVWADNEIGQNTTGGQPRADLHVNFQLAQAGESIGLFAADGTEIDSVTFVNQLDDISQGRFPDGGPSIYLMTNRTPRAPNFVPGQGGNIAPVLQAIGPKATFVNQTLSFTAVAQDADPGQSLTFTLDVGAPPDATIDPNTGVFTWTPATPGTNVITVRVTDNGAPPATDFENVVVRVTNPPRLTTPQLNGTDLTLNWPTTPGRSYRVQYKNDLNDPEWTNLGQVLTATGDTLSINDNVAGAPQRFYQLIILP